MSEVKRVAMEIRGEELSLETGKLAKQAHGSIKITYGGTVVLTTVCMGPEMPNLDYFPLQVQYSEKYYAAGKIPGGFIKREGRPKDKEVLISRLTDRPLRPLFPKNFNREVQIIPTTISADQIHSSDILSIISSSAAVAISEIPFAGPVGAVRVGLVNDELIINPTFLEQAQSTLELLVAGTRDAITMIEGGAKEISESLMLDALREAQQEIVKLCDFQQELVDMAAKPKIEFESPSIPVELVSSVTDYAKSKLETALFTEGKQNRDEAVKQVKEDMVAHFTEKLGEESEDITWLGSIFEDLELDIVRDKIILEEKRVDGRGLKDLRQIEVETSVLPRTHGSALFTRGETQSLGVVTLGTAIDKQRFDDIDQEEEFSSYHMLHYNFPPFSVGETGRVGSPGRREIGHGKLAEKAIVSILPDQDDFPYTIRMVSEILESNGSSSMASVCSVCMALLDAGVPIKDHVAGIAMGMVTEKDGDRYKILTDIQGAEDHLGDMDFKVAGTEKGITAFQMDLKIAGITFEVFEEALNQAKQARIEILDKMKNTLSIHRDSLSDYAPKIITFMIPVEKIRELIGPGGSNIKGIIEKSGANVDVDDFGKVNVTSKDEEAVTKAYYMIQDLFAEAEIGKMYQGTVKRITNFGAFVEILPGKDGLLHVSKIANHRVRAPEDVLSVGQTIMVKVTEVDSQGRINLVSEEYDAEHPNESGSSHRRSGGGTGRRPGGNRRRH